MPSVQMIPKFPIVPHPPQIVRKRAAIARIERILPHHFINPVNCVIKLVPFIEALIEPTGKVKQIPSRFVEPLAIGA